MLNSSHQCVWSRWLLIQSNARCRGETCWALKISLSWKQPSRLVGHDLKTRFLLRTEFAALRWSRLCLLWQAGPCLRFSCSTHLEGLGVDTFRRRELRSPFRGLWSDFQQDSILAAIGRSYFEDLLRSDSNEWLPKHRYDNQRTEA